MLGAIVKASRQVNTLFIDHENRFLISASAKVSSEL
jgi:hypothetical protein